MLHPNIIPKFKMSMKIEMSAWARDRLYNQVALTPFFMGVLVFGPVIPGPKGFKKKKILFKWVI